MVCGMSLESLDSNLNRLSLICWLGFFDSLTQARVILEEGTSAEELPPSDWAVGKSDGTEQ
jgi:hypothetical protein